MESAGGEMEIQKKGNKITIKKELRRGENYKISKGKKSESIFFFKKPQIVKGYSNSCSDGMGILLIDYDNVTERVVLDDYKVLQKRFAIQQAYLFKTKENNYHVVCLQKFIHPDILEMLKQTRCDQNYVTMPLRNIHRNYVLRLSDKKGSKKPRFVKLIGYEQFRFKPISSPHFNLLKIIFPRIKHPRYKKFDKLKNVCLQEYETSQ